MEDVAVAIQCGTPRRLDDAMQDFFRRTKAGLGGFPRFKGRRHRNSISIISGVRIRGNALHVPRYGQMTVRCRERTRTRLATTTRRIAMVRRDWHHRTSRALANTAGSIVIEDLQPVRMTRSAKGTAARPGRNVSARAGLNRESLRRMLEYKAHRVIAVDPRHTSRTCAACGHVDARSRRTRDRFHCVACGHADHADLNAAANILASGTGAAARGGGGGARPGRRENDRVLAA